MDLGVVAMIGYSTLLRYPELDLHYQMQFSIMLRTLLLGASYPFAGDTISVCTAQPDRVLIFLLLNWKTNEKANNHINSYKKYFVHVLQRVCVCSIFTIP